MLHIASCVYTHTLPDVTAVDWALKANYLSPPPKGGRGFLMYPPCLESQGCQFDPTFLSQYIYLLFCLVLRLATALITSRLDCCNPILAGLQAEQTSGTGLPAEQTSGTGFKTTLCLMKNRKPPC